jgi:hypothetical protein
MATSSSAASQIRAIARTAPTGSQSAGSAQ